VSPPSSFVNNLSKSSTQSFLILSNIFTSFPAVPSFGMILNSTFVVFASPSHSDMARAEKFIESRNKIKIII